MSNTNEIYSNLCQNISNITLNGIEKSENIEIYLDDLLSLDDNIQECNSETISSMIKIISENIDPKDTKYVERIVKIFIILLNKSNVELTNVESLVTWALIALKYHDDLAVTIVQLISLSLTINKLPLNPQTIKEIFSNEGILQNLPSQANQENFHKLYLNCKGFINNVDNLLTLLMIKSTSSETILDALRCINNLLDENSDLLTNINAEQALSVAWYYMAYDPKLVQNIPFELHPTLLTIPMQITNKKNASDKKKNTVCKSVNELMNSAQLPVAGDPQWNNSRVVQSCIRYAAISLLITVIKKIDPAVSFRYWSYLIFPGSPSLRQSIRSDSSWCVRLAALVALEELISQSQAFLVHAECPRTAITSFTTFSETLGVTLMKLHDDFIMLLGNGSVSIVIQTLKCLSTLVQCTPYIRISNELIMKVIENIKGSFEHPDQTVRLETLSVIHSVIISNPSVNDMTMSAKWILTGVLGFFNSVDSTSVPIILKCLQIIGALSNNYFNILHQNMKEVCFVLVKSLSSTHIEIKIQAGRTVEEIGDGIKAYLNNDENKKATVINEFVSFWQMLMTPLVTLLQDEQHISLRVIGCDCVGNISANIFQGLPRKLQVLVITVLFSCVHDVESGVRGAAIRAVARGILESGRQDDPGLVADVAQNCVIAMRDSTPNVRVKAAWALANVGDALLLNRNEEVCEDLPDNLYLELFSVSLIGAKDNDKVKCNVTRAIGNFLRLVTRAQVQNDEFKLVIEQAILALVKNASTGRDMKTKWNSCYALGNMLKNGNIYSLNRTWANFVFPELIKLAVESKNFKVRTNAVLALSAPLKRWHYGSHWVTIWSSLMEVLDSSQHIDDFKEYKHRDTLVEQVCLTLAHLASVADHDDLMSASVLTLHEDNLRHQVLRCYEQLIPERVKTFLSAVGNMNILLESGKLGKQQNYVANVVKNIFSEESVNENAMLL